MGKYPYFPKVNSTWNKEQTFDGITIKEVTTPSTNPPANYMKLYFKADGKLYKLNSSGAETVSNSTVSAITQALLDAKSNINNPSFTGIVTIPNVANLETAVVANTAKVGITSGQASEITANTAKVGITSGQASEITANTAKVGITSGQASEITANTAKISLDDNSVTLAKLAHGTADKYLGFDGSGVPAELTVSGGVPSGCILMWSGAIIAIPATWYLCDGTNGTPNLSNKFIRSGSSVGSTGGADTVSLTEAQLASHTHTQSAHTHTQRRSWSYSRRSWSWWFYKYNRSSHSHIYYKIKYLCRNLPCWFYQRGNGWNNNHKFKWLTLTHSYSNGYNCN